VATHALVTGPISGRIPISHDRHPEGFVNVTDDVIYSDDHDHILAVAHAIEMEHHARGSHPTQLECKHLDDVAAHPNGVDPDRRAQHRATHAALNDRIAANVPHVVTANPLHVTLSQVGA
jgi:hypothetical protein